MYRISLLIDRAETLVWRIFKTAVALLPVAVRPWRNSVLSSSILRMELSLAATRTGAQRHRYQVGCGLVSQVESCRHSPDVGPSIMLNRTPRSVGESYRRGNAVSLEVLRNAVGARYI